MSIQRQPPDGYLDAVAKLVPGEMLAAYFAALQVPGVGGTRAYHAALLALFAALTPALLVLSARRSGRPAPWLQYVVRTAAFVLLATSADPALLVWSQRLHWIPSVGSMAVVALAAAILAPPAAYSPLPRDPRT